MKDEPRGSSASDHAYFQALEASFIRLRGAPLLLSPADWQVAKQWRRQGIPIELVVRVMERIFERQTDSEGKIGIRSLRYFRTAVSRSWLKIRELGGGEQESVDVGPVNVPARLERLAAALRRTRVSHRARSGEALASVIETVADQLASLNGSPEIVEGALQRLDREIVDRLHASLDAETLARVERSVEKSLAGLSQRWGRETRYQTRELLIRRRLRQDLELPVLSLFSPEAREST